jgi:hypothetical protein
MLIRKMSTAGYKTPYNAILASAHGQLVAIIMA